MLENGWIKLHRKLLGWEWYDDIPTTRLFLHLLLTVNIKDDNWHGVSVPRGSRITSTAVLSKETHLSEQQVKTALRHLTKTHEITKHSTRNFTLISIVRFHDYQSEQPTANLPSANDSPTADLPSANDSPTANHRIRKQESKNTRRKEKTDASGGFCYGETYNEFYECETIL